MNTSHLGALNAQFPIAQYGSLCVNGANITHIKVVDERTYRLTPAHLPVELLWPVACACLDVGAGVVYTFSGAFEHARLISVFDLESGCEQVNTQEPIFGFVTASGHFFNRAGMQSVLKAHQAQYLKHPEVYKETFTSDDIAWSKVKASLKR